MCIEGTTNPALNIRTTSTGLPVLPEDGNLDFHTLDIDATDYPNDSGNTSWGHAGQNLFNKVCEGLGSASGNANGLEMRFMGKDARHTRIVNFKTNWENALIFFRTNIGTTYKTLTWPSNKYETLDGHNSYLPSSIDIALGNGYNILTTDYHGHQLPLEDHKMTNWPLISQVDRVWGYKSWFWVVQDKVGL
jgi:hypothetical protein